MAETFVDSSHAPNFIIFGEMGVGKSSLINLIAGANLAIASTGVTSCTIHSTEYKVKLHDLKCEVNLYDTVGLNEPTMSIANYLSAVTKAHELILSLQEKGGVHGLLFCIRGGRVSDTLQKNYRLFYEFLCQEKVPLALVITGLENEQDDMDNWWAQYKAHIENAGIRSVRQACITTIKGFRNVYEEKYVESRKKMHKMLSELAYDAACPVDANGWFIRVGRKLQGFLAPGKIPWVVSKHRAMMMQVLIQCCNLRKEDAVQLLRRIEDKDLFH